MIHDGNGNVITNVQLAKRLVTTYGLGARNWRNQETFNSEGITAGEGRGVDKHIERQIGRVTKFIKLEGATAPLLGMQSAPAKITPVAESAPGATESTEAEAVNVDATAEAATAEAATTA